MKWATIMLCGPNEYVPRKEAEAALAEANGKAKSFEEQLCRIAAATGDATVAPDDDRTVAGAALAYFSNLEAALAEAVVYQHNTEDVLKAYKGQRDVAEAALADALDKLEDRNNAIEALQVAVEDNQAALAANKNAFELSERMCDEWNRECGAMKRERDEAYKALRIIRHDDSVKPNGRVHRNIEFVNRQFELARQTEQEAE